MKVVIFCGGLGMRMRDNSENVPKPMVLIGERPIVWHLMKYYAHFGLKDFILCLGYRGDAIKRYFLEYDECASNDFTLSRGSKNVHLMNSDIQDWNITFAETGMQANVGQRLRAVQKYVADEETFLANYVDGLSDIHLPTLLEFSQEHGKIATFVTAKPNLSYHLISADPDGAVTSIEAIQKSDLWINGGYFVFKQDIFQYIQDGEELVLEPFQRLIRERELRAYRHHGFFASMDTFKDKEQLEDMYAAGAAPWMVWKSSGPQGRARGPELAKKTVIPAIRATSRRRG